jgi:hypothetical protein
MHQTRRAVMPLVRADATRFGGRFYLLEQIGMISCFDSEDIMTAIIVQGLDVRGIGTQGVFGDNELEMRVILAQLGDEAFGGIALAIVFRRAVLLHNRFGHQRNHFTKIGMDDRGGQHLVRIGDLAVAVRLCQARLTVDRLRGEVPRAIERHQVRAIVKHHGFQRLATLELS